MSSCSDRIDGDGVFEEAHELAEREDTPTGVRQQPDDVATVIAREREHETRIGDQLPVELPRDVIEAGRAVGLELVGHRRLDRIADHRVRPRARDLDSGAP